MRARTLTLLVAAVGGVTWFAMRQQMGGWKGPTDALVNLHDAMHDERDQALAKKLIQPVSKWETTAQLGLLGMGVLAFMSARR